MDSDNEKYSWFLCENDVGELVNVFAEDVSKINQCVPSWSVVKRLKTAYPDEYIDKPSYEVTDDDRLILVDLDLDEELPW